MALALSKQSGSPLARVLRRWPATLKKYWKRTIRVIARCLFTSEHEFSFSERTIFAFYVDKIRGGPRVSPSNPCGFDHCEFGAGLGRERRRQSLPCERI